MTEKAQRQFGLWSSPVTPSSVARGIRLTDVQWSPDGETLVWREERSGVGVLVARRGDDAPRDLTDELSVRARVGYGGGDFTVAAGFVVFAEQASGRLFRQSLDGGAARPITPAFGHAAAPVVSPDGRWILYVHTSDRVDRVAVVDAEGRSWPQILAGGHDFFMQPCWSPDGRRAAWVAWDHPNMPWDGSVLYKAEIEFAEGASPRVEGEPSRVDGANAVAVFQPSFTADGAAIVYVSDEGGWGRLVRRDLASGETRTVGAEETELGEPAWIQGLRSYSLLADGERAVVAASRKGVVTAEVADFRAGTLSPVEGLAAYTDVVQPAVSSSGRVALVASSSATPSRVVEADVDGPSRVVRRSSSESIAASSLSVAEAVEWTSADGARVFGLYYPPASDRFESDGKPPLVVMVHGGPTAQVMAGYSAQSQFLATRGYGVLWVNYRGSTGYGRDYMLALRRNWGVCDVEDSVSGARSLAAAGRVDGERMAIMGGSAGGFTVLQTMIVEPEVFAAGVCMFGVANQFTLVAETHKFEERYTDSLLGPLPEAAAVYRERSPQFRASEIKRPMAIFQGEIDEVVPKNQSDAIVAALERTGTPHEYHVYPGEGHGWRKAETIESFYKTLDAFLRSTLVFS